LLVLDDLTERKQAEAALRESQRSLSTLISNLSGMVYAARTTGTGRSYMSQGVRADRPRTGGVYAAAGRLREPDPPTIKSGCGTRCRAGRQAIQLAYRLRTAAVKKSGCGSKAEGVRRRRRAPGAGGFARTSRTKKRAEEARREAGPLSDPSKTPTT
jgi:PAS domain-containing protein